VSDLIRIFNDLETAQYRGNGAWLPYKDIGVLQAHIERTVERMKDAERERDELRVEVARLRAVEDMRQAYMTTDPLTLALGSVAEMLCKLDDTAPQYGELTTVRDMLRQLWYARATGENTNVWTNAPTPADSTMTGGAYVRAQPFTADDAHHAMTGE